MFPLKTPEPVRYQTVYIVLSYIKVYQSKNNNHDPYHNDLIPNSAHFTYHPYLFQVFR